MKLGFVLDDTLDSSDGVQQYVLTLGDWFRSQGHEVHYLVGETKRSDLTHVHSLSRNMHVKFNRNRMSTPLPASKKRIRQLLAKESFDVLHVQMPHSPLLAGRVITVADNLGIPVVGTFHILPASRLEALAARLLARVQRRNVKRISGIMAVSKPAQAYADSLYRLSTTIVPNPVNMSNFRSIDNKKSMQSSIVFLGRLVERKGCLELLKAIAYLHKNRQLENVQVTICGDGPLRRKLQEFVKFHNLSSIVAFAGRVGENDKIAYLQSATIAAFPSTGGESFGIVLIEAMAAGSEVVLAGDNPGYRWVMNGREQQLVDPHDTALFAAQLHHFLRNPADRAKAKRWQQKHVAKFSVTTVGTRLLKEYQAVIAKKREANHNMR